MWSPSLADGASGQPGVDAGRLLRENVLSSAGNVLSSAVTSPSVENALSSAVALPPGKMFWVCVI